MATSTKQKLQEEFNVTEQPQATTAEEVNGQDSRTRLWQSLKNGYDYQKENTAQAYEQNKSAADRAALQRGMGRSSYNMQNMANIDTEKARALTQIDQNLIADYQNRIGELEQQEAEADRWERQFAEGQRQYNENMALQREQFDASQAAQQWSQGMQEKQFEASQQQWEDQKAQWREEFDYNKMTSSQQIAYNYIMNMLEKGDKPSATLLAQAGISRSDYEQMKTKAKKSGGGGGRGNTPGTTPGATTPAATTQSKEDALMNALGVQTQQTTTTQQAATQQQEETKKKLTSGGISKGTNYNAYK